MNEEVEYAADVREMLQEELSLSADEADQAIAECGLVRRLHDAPDVQLHTDYRDAVAGMRRKGLVK